jgi:acetyltransferase-like isoleucine patch superfamily enzyme
MPQIKYNSPRMIFAALLALLPSWLKVPLYRWWYGYQIGKGVRIGWSVFVGVGSCRIGDGVRIGHGNLFYQIGDLSIGTHAQIGFLNLFRGGQRIEIGDYATILRKNVFNAILDPDFVEPVESVLILGCGSVVTTGHWLDFSDRITIGDHSIIGGRHSSFWTHNRQRGRGITVGHHCYLGSEVRFAPGVEIAPCCIVALGSVLMGRCDQQRSLIAGNPATVLRPLQEKDYSLVTRKTRQDIPDHLANALLPRDLLDTVQMHAAPQPVETL